MSGDVKGRRYSSAVRAEQAAATRATVLATARKLFTTTGYAATSVAQIATDAGVNLDTVYASVGRKAQLLLAVIDMVLGSSEHPVPAEDRAYVRAVRAAPTAREKISIYAEALARLMPEVAPLFAALRQAAVTDPECARVRDDVAGRRAANMRLFAAELRATGSLRGDLSDDDVADLVWATNAPEFFDLVSARGRTPAQYADLLTDLWTRTLLATEGMDVPGIDPVAEMGPSTGAGGSESGPASRAVDPALLPGTRQCATGDGHPA